MILVNYRVMKLGSKRIPKTYLMCDNLYNSQDVEWEIQGINQAAAGVLMNNCGNNLPARHNNCNRHGGFLLFGCLGRYRPVECHLTTFALLMYSCSTIRPLIVSSCADKFQSQQARDTRRSPNKWAGWRGVVKAMRTACVRNWTYPLSFANGHFNSNELYSTLVFGVLRRSRADT